MAKKLSLDAGSLYDCIEGKQRWALIKDGEITGSVYEKTAPAPVAEEGEQWLPVVHFDSEPFNILRQWRLAPVYTIEADRVVCTYPIVKKSLELA